MDHNIFFTIFNAVLTLATVILYRPLLKASSAEALHEAIKSRPALARAVARKSNRSYIRVCLYFCISLVAYMFIAVRENVDMYFAAFTLLVLFLISLSRVWMLRMMLGKP
ncbi:hypothetical protein UNDYM_2307 [Undibacterium sp. YM2]|uniref:hypothetical protein n=1 Tax=Undibacterium sp. YM2 TaxID=2058625 RepID=UPI001331F8B5|nr:hypothetical protein [Undibacterium sp. YM2]BBB66560.1 hypothetical protein UNDYM_2307 [Undibacterium sp. YM2]